MMAMEDLPLMQPCCNATKKRNVSFAYGTKAKAEACASEMSSYVSWAEGGGNVSEDGEAIDSISVYSGRYGHSHRGERGAIANIYEAIAQMFDVFVISPADIDCVADVIDDATQELVAELTEEKTETTGFEVQTL
eukprot:scaffold26622_cov147-Skeletonema_menzelii.AAC.3